MIGSSLEAKVYLHTEDSRLASRLHEMSASNNDADLLHRIFISSQVVWILRSACTGLSFSWTHWECLPFSLENKITNWGHGNISDPPPFSLLDLRNLFFLKWLVKVLESVFCYTTNFFLLCLFFFFLGLSEIFPDL